MDTKTEFNLNNIIALLPLTFISSVKKFAGKCPQTWSCPKLLGIDTLCGLDVTISAPRELTSFPLRHWNPRNVTLQALELFSVLSHGSIMLPPRQPRVFARLARWQLAVIRYPNALGGFSLYRSSEFEAHHLLCDKVSLPLRLSLCISVIFKARLQPRRGSC